MSIAVNPDTGDGFDAPTPAEAYADAPDLRREMHDVMELGAVRDGRRAGMVTNPPTPGAAAADRVFLLRRAALMDRMAVDDPGPGARGAAVRAAFELARLDRQHPQMTAGPHGPYSIEFDPSQRPYVRQEYAAWTAAGQPGA
ncbi:hypothetical protein TPA0906_00680 [Streptomyces olivaceus]|uniref:hypothetical protein n=1 Tax=Streptomyces olivaceus TaxID=47716 RepID=UPI0022EF8B21|nr:hypothetical protein [Streptomyces olivaceus]GHI98202.1 hypothetical protein TPA0906_00680 [Streptomyces olivaceus]